MEFETILRAILSLGVVIGLIGIAAALYKKYFMDKNLLKGAKTRRLKLEEVLYLDSKRKLVIVKKDEKEILILISPNSETII